MRRSDLFISSYNRIEQDFLLLPQYIYFCDSQLEVYSPIICDLIIRCGTEIESLYKELYRIKISTKFPEKIGVMISELNRSLNLESLVLVLKNYSFNFKNTQSIRPFSYINKSDEDFYHVFCCLKHDRLVNFHKATLKVLMLSLGALYILNQYLLDEKILLENSFFGEKIPVTISPSTNVFAVPVYSEISDKVQNCLDTAQRDDVVSTNTLKQIEGRVFSRTSARVSSFKKEECLYKSEYTPGYAAKIKAFSKNMEDKYHSKTMATALLGDDKDTEELLAQNGPGVLNDLVATMELVAERNRIQIVLNLPEQGD